jgi:hypothetical protein
METRLSLLLAIVPMAIQSVLAAPASAPGALNPAAAFLVDSQGDAPAPSLEEPPHAPPSDAARQQDLVVSLDLLHHFPLLLAPPPAASAAAARASPAPPRTPGGPRSPLGGPLPSPLPSPAVGLHPSFRNPGAPSTSTPEPPAPPSPTGSLRDLIVDACTARTLLLPSEGDLVPTAEPAEASPPAWGAAKGPWQQLMAGAALTASLRAAILASPASRREELERVYQIAVGGQDMDEQAAAASTLCGASLVRGWGIQVGQRRLRLMHSRATQRQKSVLRQNGEPALGRARSLAPACVGSHEPTDNLTPGPFESG